MEMDKATVKKARQSNLAEYLLSAGIPLIRDGKRYKHREHNSLVFTGNSYYWNSRNESGNAIDYLMRHMDLDFTGAVSALTNVATVDAWRKTDRPFELERVTLSDNIDKVRRYLDKSRFISYSVIDYLARNRLIYQETGTNNAIFPMYDENDNCVGAEQQGITKKRFKGLKANSKYGYGFNVKFSKTNKYDYALFFESAVDLLSFMDCKMHHEKKSLDNCILVSMSGCKLNIVKHTLKAFKGGLQVILCVDNDEAGRKFIQSVESAGISYKTRLPDAQYKDWNEQMTDTKRHNSPVGRALKRERDSLVGFK